MTEVQKKLAQLFEMGFSNFSTCKKALEQSNFDINIAIERLYMGASED